MKRFLQIIFASLIPLVTLADASFGVGTYNVRYKNDGDTGVHHWDARREYIVRTIAECGFDILGLNEMNTGSMYDYLKEELPKVGFEVLLTGFRTDKDPESVQAHPIVYRSSMFEVLDKGVFYLNINTAVPGTSWDNSTHQRSTHWAKMRVKDTGDIFYFFTTHLDHKGELSKNEQCRINFEKIREIAGEYPVVISGDHNTAAGRPTFYDLFSSYMLDTMRAAEEPFTDTMDGTLCGWDPNTRNRTRLDYIWVRSFKVHTYEPLRETFDTPYLPSDHLALLSRVTLVSEQTGLWEAYLDPSATTPGDGSIDAPFNSFKEAVAGTRQGGTLRIAAARLPAENEDSYIAVDRSLTIIGGYDKDFKKVVGYTEINGDGSRRLIDVASNAYLELSNFALTGGASDNYGGGICAMGPFLKLKNVTISDCSAKTGGGAVYAAQQIDADNCTFTDCSSEGNGGAVFANRVSTTALYVWWRYFMKNCTFTGNRALNGSAMYVTHYTRCSFMNCGFFDNVAANCATVYLGSQLAGSQASAANTVFARNIVDATAGISDANKGGAAIYANFLDDASLALMNCTIVGNANRISGTPADDYAASTVQVPAGKVYVYSTIIGGNTTAASTPVDISATTGSGAYNCYATTSGIAYRKSITDVYSSSADEALENLKVMFGCEADESGLLLPETDLYNGRTLSLRMPSQRYGDEDLNMVPKNQFSEALTHADVDNDAEFKGMITTDHRGIKRRTDGTSTIGALEYTAYDGVETIAADPASFICRSENGTLVICADTDVNVFDLAGRHVARAAAGVETRVALPAGVYVAKSSTKAIKIAL